MHPGEEGRDLIAESLRTLNIMGGNSPMVALFRSAAGGIISVVFRDHDHGCAIQHVITRELTQGRACFVGHTEDDAGRRDRRFYLTPGVVVQWVDPQQNREPRAALVAKVQAHVRTHGGVVINDDGELVEPSERYIREDAI